MGLIFTKGDLKEVSEEVAKYKVSSCFLFLFFCILSLYFILLLQYLIMGMLVSVFFFFYKM